MIWQTYMLEGKQIVMKQRPEKVGKIGRTGQRKPTVFWKVWSMAMRIEVRSENQCIILRIQAEQFKEIGLVQN